MVPGVENSEDKNSYQAVVSSFGDEKKYNVYGQAPILACCVLQAFSAGRSTPDDDNCFSLIFRT